jgi:hypothetical protein
MMVALPPENWEIFTEMSEKAFTELLISLAKNIKLERYKKNHRGEKKAAPKKKSSSKVPHVSPQGSVDPSMYIAGFILGIINRFP